VYHVFNRNRVETITMARKRQRFGKKLTKSRWLSMSQRLRRKHECFSCKRDRSKDDLTRTKEFLDRYKLEYTQEKYYKDYTVILIQSERSWLVYQAAFVFDEKMKLVKIRPQLKVK
jgi:hypothetical protein